MRETLTNQWRVCVACCLIWRVRFQFHFSRFWWVFWRPFVRCSAHTHKKSQRFFFHVPLVSPLGARKYYDWVFVISWYRWRTQLIPQGFCRFSLKHASSKCHGEELANLQDIRGQRSSRRSSKEIELYSQSYSKVGGTFVSVSCWPPEIRQT